MYRGCQGRDEGATGGILEGDRGTDGRAVTWGQGRTAPTYRGEWMRGDRTGRIGLWGRGRRERAAHIGGGGQRPTTTAEIDRGPEKTERRGEGGSLVGRRGLQ